MEANNRRKYSVIAAICFFALALDNIIQEIQDIANGYEPDILYIIFTIGLVMLAIGLYINKLKISFVGMGAVSVIGFIDLVDAIRYYEASAIVSEILYFLSYVALTLALISKKNGRILATIGGVLNGVGGAIDIISFINTLIELKEVEMDYYDPTYFSSWRNALIYSLLLTLIYVVGFLMVGFSMESKAKPKLSATSAPTSNRNDDSIERLTKLKQLLDDNIITQEEFEKKKKSIIGE